MCGSTVSSNSENNLDECLKTFYKPVPAELSFYDFDNNRTYRD